MSCVPKNSAEWNTRDERDHYVYIMARLSPDNEIVGPCKIGLSQHPRHRLKEIQSTERDIIVLLATHAFWKRSHARQVERAFHKTCSCVRAYGEWFNIAPSDAVAYMRMALTAFADRVLGADEFTDSLEAYDHLSVPGSDPPYHPSDFFEGAQHE